MSPLWESYSLWRINANKGAYNGWNGYLRTIICLSTGLVAAGCSTHGFLTAMRSLTNVIILAVHMSAANLICMGGVKTVVGS